MGCDHQKKSVNRRAETISANLVWIVGCLLVAVISVAAKSNREPRVIVAIFDVGFQGIDQLPEDRVIGKEHTTRDPVRDEACDSDRRYNGNGAYEKTWGWNYLGCGALRTSSLVNNKGHGYRVARHILEGTSGTAIIPITSVVDTAGQHVLFRHADSLRKPMQMAKERGARIVNMSFALSPPHEPETVEGEDCGRACQISSKLYARHFPRFDETKQAMVKMLRDYEETVFVAASGNATRLYRKGRFVYIRNDLKRRLPQALKLSPGDQLPNLFVVSLCDETGEPVTRVNFSIGAVDACVYRPTPYTVSVDKTTLNIQHPWSSDAAATFSNVVARILETRALSPVELRNELHTYPGITRDPLGRYDFFIDYALFSAEAD